jgi:hypothetical protein
MVTNIPTGPTAGVKPLMEGWEDTVDNTSNTGPVTVKLFTTTATIPLVAPFGTGTTMLVLLQLDGVARTPLKVTALVPCEGPNPVPLIVTFAPTFPWVGAIPLMLALTVKV